MYKLVLYLRLEGKKGDNSVNEFLAEFLSELPTLRIKIAHLATQIPNFERAAY